MEFKGIGHIGNYYGGLKVMEHEGNYYWCIENWDTNFEDLDHWEEIDKELYDSLISYHDRANKALK